MATWTGSLLSVEEAFHQVWKSAIPIHPSFYLPINFDHVTPPTSAQPTLLDDNDEIATAEILAGIRFGTSSSTCSSDSASPPQASAPVPRTSKRPLTGTSSDYGEEERPATGKRKKHDSGNGQGAAEGGKGGSGSPERWPPRKEFVYLSCVVGIPPVGRQKLPLFGKPCGRNEIIAKVVTMATGEGCSRKLISSHAQVLKGRKELTKPLRDLLTTEEGKNSEDEAAPTIYTLGPEWKFPVALNRLMGLPDTLDLRTASAPNLIAQFFSEPIKPIKPAVSGKKEKPSPAPSAPTPNAKVNRRASVEKQPLEPRQRQGISHSPSSPTCGNVLSLTSYTTSVVHLPTPQSLSRLLSPTNDSTPLASYATAALRRPSLPSPSEMFSSGLCIDLGETSFQTYAVPRRLGNSSPFSHTLSREHQMLPQRPVTSSDRPVTHLPPILSPIPQRLPSFSFDNHLPSSSSPLDYAPVFVQPSRHSQDDAHWDGRRGSEPRLTLGKAFNLFDEESLQSIGRSYDKVSVEMLKRQEFSKIY